MPSPIRESAMNERHNRAAIAGVSAVLLLAVAAMAGPWLAPSDPFTQELPRRLEPPSWRHPLGSDELGRDILSRLLAGAGVSLEVGAAVVLLAGGFGTLVGGLAGYVGGRLDAFISVIVINSLMAFPGILLAIALVAFLGPGLNRTVFALAAVGWVGYARLARGQVMKAKTLEFVEAARALGARRRRIFFLHILPAIAQPVLVQASVGMAAAVMAEASLSFLGLGIVPPNPSWGAMLNDGRNHLFDAPHMVIFPAAALATTVLAFNFLGDALRDWLDPKSAQ